MIRFGACGLIIIFLFSCLSLFAQQEDGASARQVLLLMGTRFEFGAFAKTQEQADAAVAAGIEEVKRIEALISSWKPTSQTSAINAAAGKSPVVVDEELFQLIQRALRVSDLTEGAFDITAGGLSGVYHFGKQDTLLPSADDLQKALERVNYKAVLLDPVEHSVFIQKPGMRIGFGAIGKGYAANKAKVLMRSMDGVYGGVVNAAGDLITFGRNYNDTLWTVGISDPRNPDKWIGQVQIKEMAVVTSGDYEKFFMHNGTRYAHIIDPRTGLPTTGVRSATVICADAEVADALATSLFVLGPEKGIALINRLKNIEGLVVDDEGKVFTSNNLILQPYELRK